MDYPDYFDPFNEYVPDYSDYVYNIEDGQLYGDDGEPVDSPVTSICENMVEQGQDPNVTLKSLLEAEFQKSNEKDVQDPSDVLPEMPYRRIDDRIFFNDSALARSVLTAEQQCSNKKLTGWILLPARNVATIRSRTSNHDKCNPVLYIPADEIPEEIGALFE